MRIANHLPQTLTLSLTMVVLTSSIAWADTYKETVLYSFSGADGANPQAALIDGRDGSYYGVTNGDGINYLGTVFKITPDGILTTLHAFEGPDGSFPTGLLKGTDGNFYGTTGGGGSNNYGTVFKVTSDGAFTTVHNFNGTDGVDPNINLIEGNDGKFYGSTLSGGTGCDGICVSATPGTPFVGNEGTIFSVATDGSLINLFEFSAYSLTLTKDGTYYGTAPSNPGPGCRGGQVFKFTVGGPFTSLLDFCDTNGAGPRGLLESSDGNLYGTTSIGGANNDGTVFKLSPDGTLLSLFSFSGGDGQYPSELIEGKTGEFYGTTSQGGESGKGTVFKITSDGSFSSLYSFSGLDGSQPVANLAMDNTGNLYGTTFKGGNSDLGVVFKLTLQEAASAPPPDSTAPSTSTPTPTVESTSGGGTADVLLLMLTGLAFGANLIGGKFRKT